MVTINGLWNSLREIIGSALMRTQVSTLTGGDI